MRRKNIRAFLIDSQKKDIIFGKLITIFVIFICAFSLWLRFDKKNERHYVTYSEEGNLSYKVFLKENEFFDNEYVEKEDEYVASLINYINAEFNYKLNMDEDNVNYNYSYRTEAVVDITMEDTKNTLYNFSENITEEEINKSTDTNIELYKYAKIDFNKYNEIAKSFIQLYDIKDSAVATLTINFYVDVARKFRYI